MPSRIFLLQQSWSSGYSDMKKNKYLIIGLIFLILSGIVLYKSTLTFTFFPTQELELSKGLETISNESQKSFQ
jgi:hypothetical protein